jgi:predicted ATPase with chaperone activity
MALSMADTNSSVFAETQTQGANFLPQPSSINDLGLGEMFVAQLILKHCFFLDAFTLKDLNERAKLHTAIITKILDYWRQEKCVEVRGADLGDAKVNLLSLGNRYALTEGGKKRAAQLLEYDSYVGPCPVALEDYWRQVAKQSIQVSEVTREELEAPFQGLVIAPDLFDQLGPALIGGRTLFLYGPSGNGKTTIALKLGEVWQDNVLIPHAIHVHGHVVRVFDEISHRPVPEPDAGHGLCDRRWVRCHRPIVVAGGELSLAMLELAYNPSLKYYEAPLQLKANNGVFIVDDFGRQQIPPQVLLNRWIIPLENRQDFLYLHTGQKFAIPFDQLMVFATNLEPANLLDPAFLRRIRSKVKVRSTDRLQFIEIFRRICEQYQLAFEQSVVEYLLSQYYEVSQRTMAACHPRDLVQQIVDYCRFHRLPPILNRENIDRACRTYFIY